MHLGRTVMSRTDPPMDNFRLVGPIEAIVHRSILPPLTKSNEGSFLSGVIRASPRARIR